MDSVVLLYRPYVNAAWHVHPSSRSTDYIGSRLLVFTILKGDYILAKANPPSSYQEATKRPDVGLTALNYKKGRLELQLKLSSTQQGCLLLVDKEGNCVYTKKGKWGSSEQLLSMPVEQPGLYFLKLINTKGRTVFSRKIELQ
jgi:hypothetical protein